ncbi:MAG TPA: AMP-binding protein [Mycobacteriales bacterium]|nr:AMP-binding protein [Mycobacteriales bacterium]
MTTTTRPAPRRSLPRLPLARSVRRLPLAGPVLRQVGDAADATRVLARAGLLAPVRADRLLGMMLSLRYGLTPAAGYAACAARHPAALALIDDEGALTFAEVTQASDELAAGYAARGLGPGTSAGLLARNGRGFLVPLVALAKTGADIVLLNTGMAGPQLAEVIERERIVAAVCDEEFAAALPPALTRLPAAAPADPRTPAFRPPRSTGKIIVLTSGTTGVPKGAARGVSGLGPAIAMLGAIPFRARQRTVLPAPLFHAWGMANLGLAMLLGSTVVLHRRFDPGQVMADVARHRASTIAAVPVMLQRILEAGGDHDTSSLRVVAVSGSALPATLAESFQDRYGDVLYNLYGSTEVGYATIAGPRDLRADPATAGRVLRGVTVTLVDDQGREVGAGDSGRVFVGSEMAFEGYTGGEDKLRLGALVSTGDTGHFDAAGRLRIDGRDDDMVVSGGENVFPGEVEDVIAAMPGVRDVAVVGVPDERFGQRLAAFVVAEGVSADAVQAHVKSRLASYKVPREVTFCRQLPRNATGKVLRGQLQEGTLEG